MFHVERKNMKKIIKGNIVDVINKVIYYGEIYIENGRITRIQKVSKEKDATYILPGLIDSHIHIESSMLSPGAFAKLAVRHGTVSCVSDPHEIGNVLGKKGIEYMINDGNRVPFKFNFGVPSCVPATSFETSGEIIGPGDVKELIERSDIKYMSEMMNYPGVIFSDRDVVKKINYAKRINKPIDGHAPGISGNDLIKYVAAGISTDHECSTIEEAEEKIDAGMMIQIREGSAARNFEKLHNLIDKYPDKVMLCSDDLHPDDLMAGHINRLIQKGLNKGLDIFNLLTAAIINPIRHYRLDGCILRVGDPADLIIIDNPENFNILETWIDGSPVYKDGDVLFEYSQPIPINKFEAKPIKSTDLKIKGRSEKVRVIEALDGELITRQLIRNIKLNHGEAMALPDEDIVKIVVLNRYVPEPPVVGFITGFGIKNGALASSIAHDSHNIVAIGSSDEQITEVINNVIECRGGIAVNDGKNTDILKLELAGLMSTADPKFVAQAYKDLNKKASLICTKMKAPFMTLAFMALLVIPELKIGDKGLFDVQQFKPVSLFIEKEQITKKK